MKESKFTSVVLLVGATVLGAFGQFFFKLAFSDHLLGPTLLVGLGAYAASTAIYFYVLSRVNLSWAYGLNGITYVVTVILAATVLAEHVSILRWVGVVIIVVGVVIVSLS